jgi:hypothetical protein
MSTPEDVGRWLHQTILENGGRRSHQAVLVRRIRAEFGEEFSYRNKNGNWAIDKAALKEFNRLRDEHIVWDRSDQTWRVLSDEQLALHNQREARKAALRAERAERREQLNRQREQGE